MGPFLALHLDRRSRESLQRQLYGALRAAILGGRLAPGARIPATRVLAGGIASPRAFRPGLAALDQFPREIWARLSARLLRHAPAALLTYGDPAGYLPLRKAIAEYLRAARGVRATADQIIVTAGSQQA